MGDGRRWAIETFGAHGVYIRDLVSRLVREEHTASADAQEASGHRSRGVYGEFWRGILEKFEQFGKLPGATLIRPGQAPYSIPVINGAALFRGVTVEAATVISPRRRSSRRRHVPPCSTSAAWRYSLS